MLETRSKSASETDGCARACASKVNLFGMQTHARSSSHHIEMCMVIVTYLSVYMLRGGEASKHAHTIDDPHLLSPSVATTARVVLVLIVVNRRTRLSLACPSVDEMECGATSAVSIERIDDR